LENAYLHPGSIIEDAKSKKNKGYMWAAFRDDKEGNQLDSNLINGIYIDIIYSSNGQFTVECFVILTDQHLKRNYSTSKYIVANYDLALDQLRDLVTIFESITFK
jgi:hypothetical protein